MAHDSDRLDRRLTELSQRLDRIERHLGLVAPPIPSPPAPPIVDDAAQRADRTHPAHDLLHRATPPTSPLQPLALAAPAEPPVHPPAAPPPLPLSRPAPPPASPLPRFQPLPAPRPAKPRAAFDLEKMIGGRWYAVAGAIILVIGVGLFFKWAYDVGLLRVSPSGRCAMGAAFGLALLAAGEFLRRKINPWAAVGAFAAGLGTIYTSTYAAYRLFDLLSPGLAFALLAATAVLGVAVSARSRLASVGVISLVAGYLTPFLFADASDKPLVLPAYLLALLAVGLILSGWRAGAFVALRTVVWFGTLLVGGVWALRQDAAHAPWATGFLALSWAAIHAELFWSATRRALITEPPPVPGSIAAASMQWRRWRPLTSSFSTTAWAVGLGILTLKTWAALPEWTAPAAGMVATFGLGTVLAGNLRFLLDEPETDPQRLGASLTLQAAALLLVTIAIAVSGSAQVVCWLVLGVAAAAAARWMDARAFAVYAFTALLIGAARLLVWDSWQPGLTASPHEVLGLRLSAWTLLVVLGAVSWIAAGFLGRSAESRREPRSTFWTGFSNLHVGLGICLLGASLINADASLVSMAIAVLATGITLGAVARRLDSPLMQGAGAAVVALGSVMTAATEWWSSRPEFRARAQAPAATVFAGLWLTGRVAAPLAAAAAWFAVSYSAHRRDAARRSAWAGFAHLATAIGVLFLFAAGLHEQSSAASIAWLWLALAAALALARALWKPSSLDALAVAGLGLSLVAWSVAWMPPRYANLASAPLAHPALWSGLALAAFAAGLGWWIARSPRADAQTRRVARAAMTVLSVLILFAVTSLETSRVAERLASDPTVRGAALSIGWGLFAFALIIAGFVRKVAAARNAGLALLGLAAVKAVFLDLRDVPQVWRVVSFIGLGLLMIGVTVVYQKFAARLTRDQAPADDA